MSKHHAGNGLIIGVDEAGRGPWAGPVTAAAVILNPALPIAGLTDSKALSEKRRDALAHEIRTAALAWSLVHVAPGEIDALNIRQATHLAMRRAVAALPHAGSRILIDGNDLPEGLPLPATAIIKGDLSEPAISAASILAKTARDRLMKQYARLHDGYGFDRHKGYGTRDHADALKRLGPSAIHRLSFAPVRKAVKRGRTRTDA